MYVMTYEPSAKQRLSHFLEPLSLEDLDRLIRRLGRAPRTPRQPNLEKKKEGPTLGKYMQHKNFRPSVAAKLEELRQQHGDAIFKRSGALRKGPARVEYLNWYIDTRTSHIEAHEKQLDRAYYERQGLAIARSVIQEQRGRPA